jgi:hypothetical protein
MLTATAMGVFEAEIAKAVVVDAVHPAHHLERRQLGVAGLDASSSARWPSARSSSRLVAVMRREVHRGLALGRILGGHRLHAHRHRSAFYDRVRRALWLLVAINRVDCRSSVSCWWGRLSGSLLAVPCCAHRVRPGRLVGRRSLRRCGGDRACNLLLRRGWVVLRRARS